MELHWVVWFAPEQVFADYSYHICFYFVQHGTTSGVCAVEVDKGMKRHWYAVLQPRGCGSSASMIAVPSGEESSSSRALS
jgi:hypothetical protein